LTFGPSFGHNLCFNYTNGSCNPILDIYVLRAFQWHKELCNPMGFDPYNHSLKIRESIGTPTPKVRAHLRMWRFIPSHSLTLLGAWDVTLGLPSWFAPLQALALVTSLRLRSRQSSQEGRNLSTFCCMKESSVKFYYFHKKIFSSPFSAFIFDGPTLWSIWYNIYQQSYNSNLITKIQVLLWARVDVFGP